MNERVPPRRKQRLRILDPDDEIDRAAIEAQKAEEAEIDWAEIDWAEIDWAEIDWILRDLVDDLHKEFPWLIYPLAVLRNRAEVLLDLDRASWSNVKLTDAQRERLDHIAVVASEDDRAFLDGFLPLLLGDEAEFDLLDDDYPADDGE
jgi:hypothetical protein